MSNTAEVAHEIEPLSKLKKDLKKAAEILTPDEARFLVYLYYQIQEGRKAAGNRLFSAGEKPMELLDWFKAQNVLLENNIKSALTTFTDHHPIGQWLKQIPGIGPVISAGLLAYIDITKAPTAGSIWRFAGLDPSQSWLGRAKSQTLFAYHVKPSGKKITSADAMAAIPSIATEIGMVPERLVELATNDKGKVTKDSLISAMAKRPWNAGLKTLCWKVGESFVKVSNKDDDIYGKVYAARKAEEIKKNDNLEFKDQAKHKLATCAIGKDTDAYKYYSIGKLPPAHIHSRAKRYAVKLFLSHLHQKLFEAHYKTPAPKPYCFAKLDGHVHMIDPPEFGEKAKVSKAS